MTDLRTPTESTAESPRISFVRHPGWLERSGVVVALFIYAFSLPPEWFVRVGGSSAGTVQGGSILAQLVFSSFLGLAILGLNGNWRIALNAIGREPLIPALVGLIGLSTIWSNAYVETAQIFVVLTFTYLFAIYLVARFDVPTILFLAAIALAAGLFVNYAFIFVLQDFGLDSVNVGTDGGSKWSGVFVTKNELGRIATLSTFVFAFLARQRRSFFVWPTLVVLSSLQVLGSDSGTSLGGWISLIVLSVVFMSFRGKKTMYGAAAVGSLTVFSVLTLLSATNLALATGLLGKNSTFTGRAPLWKSTLEFGIAERPFFGHGWAAFWSEDESFPVQMDTSFDVPHAHNAFVDAWLYLGPVGGVLLISIFLRGLVWGARHIRFDRTIVGLFPMMMVSLALIFSLSEAGVIRRDISFVLFIVAISTSGVQRGQRRTYDAAKQRYATSRKAQVT